MTYLLIKVVVSSNTVSSCKSYVQWK